MSTRLLQVERVFLVMYAYVWVPIAVAQVAFVIFVAMLWHIGRSRDTARDELSGDRLDEGVTRDVTRGEQSHDSIQRAAVSWFWWRRMAAAQRLAVVADARDRDVLYRLLLDPHPGVQGAAAAALLRYADTTLLALVIDGLVSRSAAVRRYQVSVLQRQSALVAPLLIERLRSAVSPIQLHSYIDLAESIDSNECTELVMALSIHQHPDVRLAVAKLLKRLGDESSVIKLLTMLRDPDWRVRAQAARGLGSIGDERAAPELARALTDRNWWVRFRAGLALAMLGNVGRETLESANAFPDRYARDMAAFVLGLSESSIAELAEG